LKKTVGRECGPGEKKKAEKNPKKGPTRSKKKPASGKKSLSLREANRIKGRELPKKKEKSNHPGGVGRWKRKVY